MEVKEILSKKPGKLYTIRYKKFKVEILTTIIYKKKKHILKTSQYYLYIKNIFECYIRYDVIEVMYQYGKAKLNHLKDVDIHSK